MKSLNIKRIVNAKTFHTKYFINGKRVTLEHVDEIARTAKQRDSFLTEFVPLRAFGRNKSLEGFWIHTYSAKV